MSDHNDIVVTQEQNELRIGENTEENTQTLNPGQNIISVTATVPGTSCVHTTNISVYKCDFSSVDGIQISYNGQIQNKNLDDQVTLFDGDSITFLNLIDNQGNDISSDFNVTITPSNTFTYNPFVPSRDVNINVTDNNETRCFFNKVFKVNSYTSSGGGGTGGGGGTTFP